MSQEGIQWLIARDVLYSPPLPENVQALLKKINARQSWTYDQAIAILDLAHEHPEALEVLWRLLTGQGELSDFHASQILDEIVRRVGE